MEKSIFIVCCCILLPCVISWSASLRRVELEYTDPALVTVNSISITKSNRTTFVGNLNGTIKTKIVPNTEMIQIKFFGLMSNAYKLLPLLITRTVCDIFDYEFKFIKDSLQGDYPTKCPIKKGTYYVKDFNLDVKLFPKRPWNIDDYLFDFRVFNGDVDHIRGKIYVHTSTDDEYRNLNHH